MGQASHAHNAAPSPNPLQLSHYSRPGGLAWGEAPVDTYLAALRRHARERPEAVFLDFDGVTLTFRDLDNASDRMANAFAALDVRPGDVVATMLENNADAVVAFVAINKLGAIWAPINTAYRGDFLRHQMADSSAALAICESCYLGEMLAVLGDLPQLARILVRGAEAGPAEGVSVEPLDRHRGSDGRPPACAPGPDDIACLIYTSGTTGPSKGCMISHGYLHSLGVRRLRSVAPVPGGVTWSCLPLFHIAAMATVLIANLLAGERVAIGARFSVTSFWDEIERSGARSAMLMATMLPLLAQAPDNPTMLRCRGQLRDVTGVPLSPSDRKIWHERFGVSFMNTFAYGQTEANFITLQPWGEPLPPLESMGPPAEEVEVMVAGDDGRCVPVGETGELWMRPRQPYAMFSGYWRRPQDTLANMKDLWWRTGDLVRMDAQGFLYFIDRKKDYLRSRGENISSFELETALLKHPALKEAACHAVDNGPGLEADVKATLVLQPGAELTERALFDWALERLPYFAVPRFIEFRQELPKTPTGRVQKQQLRADGKTAASWDAVAEGLIVRRRGARPAG